MRLSVVLAYMDACAYAVGVLDVLFRLRGMKKSLARMSASDAVCKSACGWAAAERRRRRRDVAPKESGEAYAAQMY